MGALPVFSTPKRAATYDPGMNWVPLMQLLITGFVAFWGVPAAWEYWSRERRLAARIERNVKVLTATNLPAVDMVLQEDIRASALQLAAIRAHPWPFKDIRELCTATSVVVVAVWAPALGLPSSTPWTVAYATVGGIAVVVDGPKLFTARKVLRARRNFLKEHSEEGLANKELANQAAPEDGPGTVDTEATAA